MCFKISKFHCNTRLSGLVLLGLVASLANASGDDKIVGGHLAAPVPYMSSVQKKGHHFCGGCLLTLSNVLTACHCVGTFSHLEDDTSLERVKVSSPSLYKIYTGHPDRLTHSKNLQIRKAKKLLAHPKCGKEQGIMQWDFALIITVNPFKLTEHVRPTKLYSMDKKAFEQRIAQISNHSQCWVMGWGKTGVEEDSPPTSRYLKYARMRLIGLEECRDLLSMKSILFESYEFENRAQMCALGVNGSESDCTGDSGGPFLCDGYVVGTVSYGFDCGHPHEPAVYTRLSEFVEWYGRVQDNLKRSSKSLHHVSLALFHYSVLIHLLKI